MPRIRTIKPEFWSSEAVGTRLPGPDGRQARLLFIALWNHAEDHGVARAAPALLRSVAFPYDEDVSAADVSRWLGMLERARLVVLYARNGFSYAWIRGFVEHQKIDRPSKTTLPEPSSIDRGECSSTRGALDEPSLLEGKGREGKVEDLGTASQEPTSSVPVMSEEIPQASEADVHPVEPEARPVLELVSPAGGRQPRKPSDAERLYGKLQEIRMARSEEAGCPRVPDGWAAARINRQLGPVVRSDAARKAMFEAAMDLFLEDEAGAALNPPWSLGYFLAGQAQWESKAAREGA